MLDIAPDDAPALFGCGFERLPILVGGGVASSDEGEEIEFEYELLIWDYRAGELPKMMETVSWGGGGIASVRPVTISPSE